MVLGKIVGVVGDEFVVLGSTLPWSREWNVGEVELVWCDLPWFESMSLLAGKLQVCIPCW